MQPLHKMSALTQHNW